MTARLTYHMKLLEGRAKRLNELLEIAAPAEIICQEIRLLAEAAEPFEPQTFKAWNHYRSLEKDNEDEESQSRQIYRIATG